MDIEVSLVRYILENTRSEIYFRGLDYLKKNKVVSFLEEPKKIKAIVLGSSDYSVEFRQGPKYIKGYCDCPYAETNDDYCKHIVALALYYDRKKNVDFPSPDEVEARSLEVDYSFDNKINAMFADPLSADLELLATASDYGSWVRPHARITLISTLKRSNKISLKDIIRAFKKIKSFDNRYNFDSYFCAGEVSAVVCLTFDNILDMYLEFDENFQIEVFIECVDFYYNIYLQLIDGSDGIWQIPQARIVKMLEILKSLINDRNKLENIREILNNRVEGWGDVLDDLKAK